jgi:hypothetical protein
VKCDERATRSERERAREAPRRAWSDTHQAMRRSHPGSRRPCRRGPPPHHHQSLSVCPSARPSVRPSVLSVCLSQTVCPVCLSVRLSSLLSVFLPLARISRAACWQSRPLLPSQIITPAAVCLRHGLRPPACLPVEESMHARIFAQCEAESLPRLPLSLTSLSPSPSSSLLGPPLRPPPPPRRTGAKRKEARDLVRVEPARPDAA